MKDSNTIKELAFVKAHFSTIPQLILELESAGKELTEVVRIMENFQKEASSYPGETGEVVRNKVEFVLTRNPGWSTAVKLANVLNGNSSEAISETEFTPTDIASCKYLPLVSVDVERSFSRMKLLLSDLRKSFKPENFEKHLVVQANVFTD